MTLIYVLGNDDKTIILGASGLKAQNNNNHLIEAIAGLFIEYPSYKTTLREY